MATRIFLWAAPATGWGVDDLIGYAMTETGRVLATHLSSSYDWAKHDLGLTSDWKHEKYRAACPHGYELVWLDDPEAVAAWRDAMGVAARKEVD